MRTSITSNYLDTRAGEEAGRILRNCVHCGFCNATCPTYLLLGDELDGPRGRIYLIKNMLEGETPRPLSQRLFRFSLRKFLLSKKLFAASLRLGQAFRPVLPQRFRQNIPLRAKTAHVWPVTRQQRKVLLVEGCVQTTLQPDIDKAAAIIFNRAGIQSLRIKAAGCCGAISHHLDAENETHAYIKANIDAWWPLLESESVEAICMTASGCGVMIRDYAHLLADDLGYAARAEKISALYRDPGEILSGENIEATHTGRRIAFHPPCTLQHGLKLNCVIETLLSSMGFELVAFENKHLCCGSAGTYSITQKQLSTQLRDNKLAAIETHAPELIVTANIGCQTHLQSGTNTPVMHWLELLA